MIILRNMRSVNLLLIILFITSCGGGGGSDSGPQGGPSTNQAPPDPGRSIVSVLLRCGLKENDTPHVCVSGGTTGLPEDLSQTFQFLYSFGLSGDETWTSSGQRFRFQIPVFGTGVQSCEELGYTDENSGSSASWGIDDVTSVNSLTYRNPLASRSDGSELSLDNDGTISINELDFIGGASYAVDISTDTWYQEGDHYVTVFLFELTTVSGREWTGCEELRTSERTLMGSDQGDILVGDPGMNVFVPLSGNDVTIGDQGDDRYIFNLGDGSLVIMERDQSRGIVGGGEDTLQFGKGIKPSDLDFNRDNHDLEIDIFSTPEHILIKNWFAASTDRIELLEFADGELFDISLQFFSSIPTSSTDWVGGDNSNNILDGLADDDVISGRGGDDQLYGGRGDDLLIGGLGADFFDGGENSDTVAYYDSNEAVTVSLDNSVASSGGTATGDTFLSTENIIGSDLNDILLGDRFNNIINGGLGDDQIDGKEGADELSGAEGNDIINGGPGQDTIFGNEGDDEIYSDSGDDVLWGGDGLDIIYAGSGYDEIHGGGGANQIHGGLDKDTIYGGPGDEELYGDGHDDVIYASGGDDLVGGGTYHDKLFGEDGNDTIYGDHGNDYVSGGSGQDIISGGADHDVIEADSDNDMVQGDAGNDFISGGTGDDTLEGGENADFLLGDSGNDVLIGGEETDFYIFDGDFGLDTVQESSTRLRLDELVFSGVSIEQLWLEVVDDDLLISVIGTNNQVLVENYSRFRVHSDIVGGFLEQLNAVFRDQTPVTTLLTDTQVLSVSAVNELATIMSTVEQPASVDLIPANVTSAQATLWAATELAALEDRIEYQPVLESQQLETDEDIPVTGMIEATDQNPDEVLIYSVDAAPSQGELVLDSETGEFTFTPSENFSGFTTALVEVTDSYGLLDNATLAFRVYAVDDPGVFANSLSVITTVNTPVVLDVGFSDTDNILGDYIDDDNASLGNVFLNSGGDNIGDDFLFVPFNNAVGLDEFEIELIDRSGRIYTIPVSVEIQ